MTHTHTHFLTDEEIAVDIADTIDLFDAVIFDFPVFADTWFRYDISVEKVRDLLKSRDDLRHLVSIQVERLVVLELKERLEGWKYARNLDI